MQSSHQLIVDLKVETKIEKTPRVLQLSGMFDCPVQEKLSRGVTHPDWQGLGIAFLLFDTIAAAYKTLGYECRLYPAHPSFTRSCDRSRNWSLQKRPGKFSDKTGNKSNFGSRPCAVFRYEGAAMSENLLAHAFILGKAMPAFRQEKGGVIPTSALQTDQ